MYTRKCAAAVSERPGGVGQLPVARLRTMTLQLGPVDRPALGTVSQHFRGGCRRLIEHTTKITSVVFLHAKDLIHPLWFGYTIHFALILRQLTINQH